MRLYLDDDSVERHLVRLLQQAGHDVLRPADVGLTGRSDAVHLRHAASTNRVLLSANHKHFQELHDLIQETGGVHPGIMIVRYDNDRRRDLTPRGILTAVTNRIAANIPVENQFIIVNNWRYRQESLTEVTHDEVYIAMHSVATSALGNLGVSQHPAGPPVGAEWRHGEGPLLSVRSPIDGSMLVELRAASAQQVEAALAAAAAAFPIWRDTPAPLRGELVRRIGNAFRKHQDDLASLVTAEVGKITAEARGEVQEVIDICDFAVGLSRQLYGKTIASERPGHRLAEYWHPLGPVGVITAFNFPVAVWAWNAMIGLVCGDPIVWKSSEKAPLCAIACQSLVQKVIAAMPGTPAGISKLVIGRAEAGQAIAASPLIPLVSATGSVPMGRAVAQTVGARLGRTLLELGGNNGMVVAPSADLELAVRSIVFAAAGTCGQRCTTLRRLIVHESIADELRDRVLKVFSRLTIGDPRRDDVLVGPLIDQPAFEAMEHALKAVREQGGTVHSGGRLTEGVPAGGYYVRPALVEIAHEAPIIQQETFAPILYLMRYRELDEAIRIHNGVPQGLSSAILTRDVREAERFCSAAGSDCGIVNVNVGTSGAEIGGAFGGEKETGGGRESGSDSWKAYMRRVTSTVNYSDTLPLAQGVRFDI